MVAVEGRFLRGEAVACIDEHGNEVARGLVNYIPAEARRIIRHPTRDLAQILGYLIEPELINHDNKVLL